MAFSIAIAFVQAAAGAALFIGHGVRELDVKKNMAAFEEMGYPSIIGAWQSLVEVVFALAMAIGVFPRIAAAGIALSMLGAIRYHSKRGDDFFGEWESATLYLIIAVLVVLYGNGWIIGIEDFMTLPAWMG